MPDLTARFSAVDQMSSKIDIIAQAGLSMVEQFERAGDVASNALDGISDGASGAVSAVDGVASSIAEVATQTDHWTTAAENYDKSAMEAIYTTEELVEMGLKSAEALQEQENMMTLCERSATSLGKSLETATEAQSELGAVMDEAAKLTAELSKNEDVSAETKAALSKAAIDAAAAMNELSAAQREAEAAMAACDELMASGTTDLETLETAAERAGHASEALAEANRKASDATDELSKATEKASEEAEEGGKKGIDAANAIASALTTAGITSLLKEIAQSVYDLVDAFSEAESTIVKATGASRAALDGLAQSMMDAYAASKTGSLDEAAAAVGEINTRLGYTDDILTDTTGLFLDFAAATGGNAASSVRIVTQLMRQWNVPASEMESILDRLTYAGQASGISVDTLSQQLIANKAILDQLGFSLDEATAMFMNFELAGTNTTAVMTGFRSALSSGAISSLEELYDVFDQISSGAMTAADASELFGSRAGPAIVDAVNSGVLSLKDMVSSLEAADGTLEKTAATAQTLSQKWTQAGNNISAAFTSAVEPAVSGISSGLADIANGIGTFLNEHQDLTKILTALGVGLGVVALGIIGVSVASLATIPAVSALGTAINAAIWPITLIAAAVAAVTAAVLFLVDAFKEDLGETEGMTATTRAQYYELQNLNDEYERTCEEYGETSEEALRLKYEVDDLSAAFESNRQTLEEFQAEVDDLCQSTHQLSDDFNSSLSDIRAQEVGTLALIQKYQDLSEQAVLTGAQQKELEAVTTRLKEAFPDLAAAVDKTTISTEDYVEAMRRSSEQLAEEQRQQQAQQAYVDALAKRAELTEELEKAQANYNAELEAHDMVWNETMQKYFNGSYTADSYWASWTTDLDEYKNALDEVTAANEENEALIAQIEQGWEATAEAEAAAADECITAEEAVATAYGQVQAKVEELCAAYDEAYQAALESFEGQFGLFDEAQADMDATVANAQAALDSQLAYWETYSANINVLKNTSAEDLGITQENYDILMSYVQDGSAEAAGLAQSMVENINSGNLDAVAALANTAGEIQTTQEELADTTAEWQTDFTEKMLGYQEDMLGIIQDMDMSEEARASAEATINSYAEEILSGKDDAVAAAKEVSDAVSAALSTNLNVSVSTTASVSANEKGTLNAESIFLAGENGPELVARPTAAYATGTTNSADFFIAGENGPELIVGEQGSTVFPTQETDRLIDALNTRRQPMQVFVGGSGESGRDGTGGRAAEQVKRILLEIAGSGAIEVNGNAGVDRSTVLEILTEHLKPVLMQIIQSEIYEEGELAYEY